MQSDLHISVNLCPSQEYVELVWDEFFLSRGRGISIEQHFPWLFNKKSDLRTIEVYVSGEFAGGLSLLIDREIVDTARIGLVCIDKKFRGLKLSKILLENAINISKEYGLLGVVLWTSKHRVYQSVGFESIDNNIIVNIYLPPYSNSLKGTFSVSEWDIPIPPFAVRYNKYQKGEESVYIVKGQKGNCLYHYSGCDEKVYELLSKLNLGRITLHLNEHSSLLKITRKRAQVLDESSSDLQMWLINDSNVVIADTEILNIYSFSDRI